MEARKREEKDISIHFRLTKRERRAIKEAAWRRRMSMSDLIRAALAAQGVHIKTEQEIQEEEDEE